MLHIIGWVIFILIGILLAVIGIVLLVPVRYEGKVDVPGEWKLTTVYGKATWLLHLVSFNLVYEHEECSCRLRVAWKTIGEKKESEEAPQSSSQTHHVQSDSESNESLSGVKVLPEQKPEEKSVQKPETKTGTRSGNKIEEKKIEKKIEKKKEKKSLLQRIMEKLKHVYRRICDSIKKATDLKEEISRFLNDEVHRSAFSRLKKEKIWIYRLLKPREFQMKLHYGFSDPYHTGLLTAFFGMIYPLMGDQVDIQPDFEEEILEGRIFIKGKIRILHGVIFGLHMIMDASVRKTFNDIMNRKNA